jgi:hypothetical protein
MKTAPKAWSLFASFALAVVAAAVACGRAEAATYVPVADEALVDQAELIVLGRVVERRFAAAGPPATEYVFAVERAVRGRAVEELVVRVPGGVRPGGLGLKIWGAPAFRDGERALLFLARDRGGVHAVLHLSLGAFHVVDALGRPAVLRDLSAMREAGFRGGRLRALPARSDLVRDLDLFTKWVADRGVGVHRSADYFVALPEAELRRLTERFTLFECPFIPQAPECEGLNFRWFEFDNDGNVPFHAHSDGQQGVSGGGFDEFQTALDAWNGDAATKINSLYGGTTSAATGFDDGPDGINTILFNDVSSDSVFNGPFDCEAGGVLAVGGPWFDPSASDTFNGRTFVPIAEADIITNSNLACFFADSPDGSQAAAELFGHELGHTLGIGHSCGDGGSGPCDTFEKSDSLMRAFIHDDGRGASLRLDDRLAGRSLYQAPASFFTVIPCRLADTRNPPGPFGGPALSSGVTRTFPVGGDCGVPATAAAVALNVTVLGATGGGHVTVFAADAPAPSTSTINFGPAQTRANNAVISLSLQATASLSALPQVTGGGVVHLIIDVNGYFQ